MKLMSQKASCMGLIGGLRLVEAQLELVSVNMDVLPFLFKTESHLQLEETACQVEGGLVLITPCAVIVGDIMMTMSFTFIT